MQKVSILLNMKPKYLIEPTGQFPWHWKETLDNSTVVLHENLEEELYVHSTYIFSNKRNIKVLEINKSLLFLLKYCMYTVQTYLQSKIRI